MRDPERKKNNVARGNMGTEGVTIRDRQLKGVTENFLRLNGKGAFCKDVDI